VREDQFLEDIFGVQARLENKEWMTKLTKDAKWIFDSSDVRKRLHNLAGIDLKYEN
jgi:hypothetical protein